MPTVATCSECGKEKNLRYQSEDGLLCSTCYLRRKYMLACSACGNVRRVRRMHEGQPLCTMCWQKHPSQQARCAKCETESPVYVRIGGRPYCQLCRPRKEEICAECEVPSHVHKRREDGAPLCKRCYDAIRSYREPKNVAFVFREPRRTRICFYCNKNGLCTGYLSPTPRCRNCTPKPTEQCTSCHENKTVHAYWPDGPVCDICYGRYSEKKKTCAQCGSTALCFPSTEGDICRQCNGWGDSSRCRVCNIQEKLYFVGTCARCYLRWNLLPRFLEQGSQAGWDTPDFKPVVETLAGHASPKAVIKWLESRKASTLLSAMALGYKALSHETLDEHPSAKEAEFVRSVLVSSGVITARNETQIRIEKWFERYLSTVPAEDKTLISLYGRWGLFRRLRHKIQNERLTDAGIRYLQGRLRIATRFLAWLRTIGKTMETVNQSDIERWLVSSEATTAYTIRDFIRWAKGRRLVKDLDVPRRITQKPTPEMAYDKRWATVERLMKDESLDDDVRLIGLFSLVFGQHLSRSIALTVDRISVEGAEVYIRFGRDPLLMPTAFGHIVQRQAARAATNPKSKTEAGSTWLFPGQNFGKHMTPDSIQSRLAEVGVPARASRNGALIELAASMEPGVLACLLNTNPKTAVKWAFYAGKMMGDYAQIRYSKSRKRAS